jgi:hypothetical protein
MRHHGRDIARGCIDIGGNSTILFGNPTKAVQKPCLANPSPSRDVEHKPATVVIGPVLEVTPKRAKEFFSTDKFILTATAKYLL